MHSFDDLAAMINSDPQKKAEFLAKLADLFRDMGVNDQDIAAHIENTGLSGGGGDVVLISRRDAERNESSKIIF